MLCVISCRKPSGHQPLTGLAGGFVVVGTQITEARFAALWKFAASGRASEYSAPMPHWPLSESWSARMTTSRGRPAHGSPRAAETASRTAPKSSAYPERSSGSATTAMSAYCGPQSVPMSNRGAFSPPDCCDRNCETIETLAWSASCHWAKRFGWPAAYA